MTDDLRNLDAARLATEARRARRLARALVGDPHDGDDVAQDAWLTALRHPPAAGAPLGGWIAGIVRNHGNQLRRTERRRLQRELAAAASRAESSTDEAAERLDLLRRVLDEVHRLEEPFRATILLRFVEGLEPLEVARRLDVPHATVRTRLKRGLERLRARLDHTVDGGRRAWLVPLAMFSLPAPEPASAAGIPARATRGAARLAGPTSRQAAVALLAAVAVVLGTLAVLLGGSVDPAPATAPTADPADPTPRIAASSPPREPASAPSRVEIPFVNPSAPPGPASRDPHRFVALAHLGSAAGAREVSLWEVRVAAPAIRRVTLGESPWNATPLNDSPRVLRWQVPPEPGERRGPYRARILHVDLDRYEVRELLRAQRVRGLGTAERFEYADTSNGPVRIDTERGRLRRLDAPFDLLARRDDRWLIEIDGALALFDATRARIGRRFTDLPAIPAERRHATHWLDDRFVVRSAGYSDAAGQPVVTLEFGKPGIVFEELRIADLETGRESVVQRRVQAVGGSGIGVIPVDLPIESQGRQVRYAERRPAEGSHADLARYRPTRDAEWVTLDVAADREVGRTAFRPEVPDREAILEEHDVPESLREAFRADDAPARPSAEDLARAFLARRDLIPERIRAVCRTADGTALLVWADDSLHLCDFAAAELHSWPAPEDWSDAVGVSLHDVTEPSPRRGR